MLRPGTLINVGNTIESLAGDAALETRGERPAVVMERIQADIQEFQSNCNLTGDCRQSCINRATS